MKDYRFYAEFESNSEKRKWTIKKLEASTDYRNCIAIYLPTYFEQLRLINSIECASSTYYHKNSACCWGGCSLDYLMCQCIRVSEKLARKLHPELFKYLEQ